MLVGREREGDAVAAVVRAAREGESRTLVLRGEPGVGKTALLAHAVALADGMQVLRATGVESEAELEYSGLLELLRPLLRTIDELPARQAAALQVALGLGDGEAPDRFLAGAATLSLLAAAGEKTPLLIVVDDAQWLDSASADAVRFAARRLLADRVGFLLAARPAGFDSAGLMQRVVTGLDARSVAELVAATEGGASLSAADADALFEATAGNPLAVIELARAGVVPPQGSPGPFAVTEAIERAFAGRLANLPESSRRALCIAAAADTTQQLAQALDAVGLGLPDLASAEDAGLVAVGADTVSFAHPLLRSVAYHARPASERRAAHAALADGLTGPADVERRAWHLASAALGPDEAAAAALADAAAAARARGGHAGAADALERAGRLTADPVVRRERLGAAAHAAWDAGEAARAGALAGEVLEAETDPALRAELMGLAGRVEFQSGDLGRAHALLVDAAEMLADLGDRTGAVTLLGVAGLVLHNLARVEDAVALGRRALELASGESDDVRIRATYHVGRALQIGGRTDEAEPLLEAVVGHLLAPAEPSRVALQRAAIALAVLDRPREAMELARRTLAAAQAAGPMQVVYALSLVAQLQMYLGDWRGAAAGSSEGYELARDMGQENIAATFASFLVRIAGARGDGGSLGRWEPIARAAVNGSGNRFERLQLDHALGLLSLAEDRLEDAVERLAAVVHEAEEHAVIDRDLAPEPDLVEALVRLGRRDEAKATLARWVARGADGARSWAPPLVARCRSLVADEDPEWEPVLEAAATTADLYATARTALLAGESLRRRNLRVEARRQLTHAVEIFERLDADAWAERGRRELRATGAKLRRGAGAGDELTPQELQVALQVSEGKANKEVAAALFLSPKTIEFHLGRIYRKLGVSSRAELVRRFAAEHVPSEA